MAVFLENYRGGPIILATFFHGKNYATVELLWLSGKSGEK
jgi:hypothetical protein